ncbi:hypothetical protein PsYK624_096280 [Phanerochaete sordida]|uniref:DUF7587 domain-containing protein n=1 Tax=Phanerochaete sordida TaxID=48140 RepID=A0A9P3GH01_9APHY|nr:hypothetical protein PsYK624_096280 [Phanerochaete sordida]
MSVFSPTTALSPTSEAQYANALPQYGFGPQVTFDGLVQGNPFLFRVYTPHGHPPQYEGSDPFFVGARYDDAFTSAAFRSAAPAPAGGRAGAACTYADVIQHLDWTRRAESPYISTSFSFAWAIWEAIRRYHGGVKHDVQIAVIDARAIADHAVTAVELLMKASPKERHRDHWKWYRFALESQDVLVWGHIPGNAVLTTIPLLQILSKLPSYFLYHDIADAKESPLFKLGWDYTKKKPSYRQFCQAITDRFMQMSVDRRLRDTTAGSVRLALALLRPWLHAHVSDDFARATQTAFELAYVVAQWPGQWWAREHPEIRDLVRCIVHMVGEEMREARRVQALADATRMQDIVGGLEQLAHAHAARSRSPRSPSALRTPLPLSPVPSPSPTLPPSPAASDHKRHFRLAPLDIVTDDMQDEKAAHDMQDDKLGRDMHESRASQTDAAPALAEGAVSEKLVRELVDEVMEEPRTAPRPFIRATTTHRVMDAFARTTSCFLTGLLVGSFITLCVLAPDRRPIMHHLT